MADQLAAAGAHGGADGQFAPALGGPRQQQVGGVGHGDEQHQGGRDHEDDERRAGFVARAAVAALAFGKGEARVAEALDAAEVAGMIVPGLLLHQAGIGPIESGRGLLARDAWFEPRNQVDPIIVPAIRAVPVGRKQGLEGHGHIDVEIHSERRAIESVGGDADDGERVRVHADGLVEHVRSAVSQHGHGIAGARAIILGSDGAA